MWWEQAWTLVSNHWKLLLGWLWLILGVILAVHIVLQRRSPVATLAWILALCLISPIGLILYRFIGPQRVQRQTLRRMRSRMLLGTEHEAKWGNYTFNTPSWFRSHSQLIESCCEIPASSCHVCERLLDGGATYDAILQAIHAAQRHIHLEYYIFEPDQTGTQFINALLAKLQQGVKVRLLVDGVGSGQFLGHKGKALRTAFTEAGGELAIFHPTRFDRWRPFVNLRTHRKIVVIDGTIGFTGGVNITDKENTYLNPTTAYRDTHLRLEGAGVRWIQYLFLQDWVYASGKHQFEEDVLVQQAQGEWRVHVAASGPDSEGQAIHHSMLHAINTAKHRIWLTTPYFVPTEPAYLALVNAARRGVDVQILVPYMSDSLLVTLAARSYYYPLQNVGVKIFEYHNRLLHAKTLLVDDSYSMVATANFDNRSFLLNFEAATVIYNRRFNKTLEQDFLQDLQNATPASERLHQLRWYHRFPGAFARLLSPLL